MLALPTAKTLLFLALSVGPSHAPTIYATSNSEGYVWTSTETGWSLVGMGFPSSDFTRDPSKSMNFTGNPSAAPSYLRAVAHHDWSRRNSAMVFDNGDRVEKHGDHAFYIINAGGPNEKIFTILFPKK
jgi:hypothetical protein